MFFKRFHIDYPLAVSVFGLLIIGAVILASVSAAFSFERFGSTGYYFFHQLIAIFAGLFLGTVAFFIPLEFFKKFSFAFIILAMLLMAVVFIPGVGVVSGGAPRWIKFFACARAIYASSSSTPQVSSPATPPSSAWRAPSSAQRAPCTTCGRSGPPRRSLCSQTCRSGGGRKAM